VVTSKALFGFDEESRVMTLLGVLRGFTAEEVLAEMEFKPLVANPIEELAPPTAEELRILREEIDPSRAVVGRTAK
jgi:glutaconate CoA-transferase subunit B